MGYICPDCGEGLPEDETCPCQSFGEDGDGEPGIRSGILGPLTAELADVRSPVRRFLGDQFSAGLRETQRRFRENAPPMVIPPATGVNPGTLGNAADWLLRFLVHPRPALDLAVTGAMLCGGVPGLEELAGKLGLTRADLSRGRLIFGGPVAGNTTEPGHLARACWALALLTEAFRAGPIAVRNGPLGPFMGVGPPPAAADLLALAPPAAVDQLAQFREVFESGLLPALARQRGTWAVGPTFTGSALMNADADLIAAGLLLELKTSAKRLSLGVADLFQVIGYALLDYDDEFSISSVGIFSARYAYLATWDLGALLDELAGHPVSLATIRSRFRELLTRHTAPPRRDRTVRPPRACEQPLTVSAALAARVSSSFSRPGDNTIPDQVCCEIQRGHRGAHLAQVQAFGADEAWAQWATGDTHAPAVLRFSDDTLCEATGRAVDDGEDDTLCQLPAGHPGEHTFRLQHVYSAGRSPSPANAAKLAQAAAELD